MGSCVNFPPPAGSRCSIIECKSTFDSLKNDWQLTFCPINTADNRFCADVMPGSQSQFCIDNQSFGLMTQPPQIWTYGCSANFTVCSMPAQTPSLGPTVYPPTTANPTTPSYPFTNNQPLPIGPVTNRPAPNNVNEVSRPSTAFTSANDFRTSSIRPPRYSQSDDSPNKIGSVDSSVVIGCAVGGAIILVLLIVLLVVFLRRRRSKKNGNTSDIEWNDYTGKSRNQNNGNTNGIDVSTLPVRSTPNGNDKTTVNGQPPVNDNQPVQEQFINGHDNKGYNQTDTNGQTNGHSNGKTKDNNGGFSV